MNVTRKGNKLTIQIDLDGETKPSASGKTNVVASTHGFADIAGEGGFKLSLNLTAPKDGPKLG